MQILIVDENGYQEDSFNRMDDEVSHEVIGVGSIVGGVGRSERYRILEIVEVNGVHLVMHGESVGM